MIPHKTNLRYNAGKELIALHRYIKILSQKLTNPPVEPNTADIQTMLDFLWSAYTDEHPIDSNLIRKKFTLLETIFDQLSFDDSNLLFSVTCGLCSEYERLAFLEGLRVGACIIAEIFFSESSTI